MVLKQMENCNRMHVHADRENQTGWQGPGLWLHGASRPSLSSTGTKRTKFALTERFEGALHYPGVPRPCSAAGDGPERLGQVRRALRLHTSGVLGDLARRRGQRRNHNSTDLGPGTAVRPPARVVPQDSPRASVKVTPSQALGTAARRAPCPALRESCRPPAQCPLLCCCCCCCCWCCCGREAWAPRGRRRGTREWRWSGAEGGSAGRAAAAPRGPARPRPPCRRGTPPDSRKCGCSGRSPCWRRRRGHAGGRPRSVSKRPARRLGAAAGAGSSPPGRASGQRRGARVSRQEVRPPLLSRCGRGGGAGVLGRAARRGRPSEHALPEAGAAGRAHIARLAAAASGEFRGRRFALSRPGSPRAPARASPQLSPPAGTPSPLRPPSRCRRQHAPRRSAGDPDAPPWRVRDARRGGEPWPPREAGRNRGPSRPPPRRREPLKWLRSPGSSGARGSGSRSGRVLRAARRAQPPAVTSSGCWRQCKAAGAPPLPLRAARHWACAATGGRGGRPAV